MNERMAERLAGMHPHQSVSLMSTQCIKDSFHQKGHIAIRIATQQPIGYNIALASAVGAFSQLTLTEVHRITEVFTCLLRAMTVQTNTGKA